jgi:hypothetical protein
MQSIHSSPRRTPAATAAVPGGWIDLTREGFCYAQSFGILSFSVVAQSLVNWPYGIESSNKFMCHVRLKRSGAWWYAGNSNHMLALRCAKYNGTLDQGFVRYQQRLRASSE